MGTALAEYEQCIEAEVVCHFHLLVYLFIKNLFLKYYSSRLTSFFNEFEVFPRAILIVFHAALRYVDRDLRFIDTIECVFMQRRRSSPSYDNLSQAGAIIEGEI